MDLRNCQTCFDSDTHVWQLYHKGKLIGKFEYTEDETGRMWLNGADLEEDFHRKGLGTRLLRKAIREYGAVYFYSGDRIDLNTTDPKFRSVYLTEQGEALLKSCLRKRIVKKEWVIDVPPN